MHEAEIREELVRARDAVNAATQALDRAEHAARDAGIELPEAGDRVTTGRMTISESDGTTRMALGDSSLSRTLPLRGTDHPHPGRPDAAGMLFLDEDGTESGALVHTGRRDGDGPTSSHRLSFDDYEQNEALVLGRSQRGLAKTQFLDFFDQPDWSIADLVHDREGLSPEDFAHVRDARCGDATFVPRMHLGREEDGSVGLSLHDASGAPRIRLVVAAGGQADVQVLDDDGTARSLVGEDTP